ncbi:MAG: hypothetical protein FJ087_23090 [Deltaproteobacteria bacterium]|nr:hypothetical protein [Deltaproteobacteria bacterium]
MTVPSLRWWSCTTRRPRSFPAWTIHVPVTSVVGRRFSIARASWRRSMISAYA